MENACIIYIFITLTVLVNCIFSSEYNCDNVNSCTGTNFCTANEACIINCVGENACKDATFYCPNNYDCDITSDGSSAMNSARVYGGDKGDLTLLCNQQECFAYGRLYCPSSAHCNITSSVGHFNFGHSYVYAQNSKSLTMYSEANWGFGYADIYCPYSLEAGPQNNCHVTTENAQNMLVNTKFFAVESFVDLDLTCEGGTGCDGGVIYCTDNYSSDCTIKLAVGSNNSWECTDSTAVCHDLMLDPCTDNVQNFDEEDIDCGGSTCEACPTCDDGIQNQDETGVDCGGPCYNCPTFHCTQQNTCTGTNFCPSNEACVISCVGENACKNAVFYCPNNHNCDIISDGSSAMNSARIYGGDKGDLTLSCNQQECFAYGRLYCPSSAHCNITSSVGHFNFGHSYVYAQNSKSLTMYSEANWGFGYADIYCPYSLESGPQNNCHVTTENAQNMLVNTKFFAVESFVDLDLTCEGGTGCDGGVIYCTDNYSSDCTIKLAVGTNNSWECTDSTAVCHDLMLDPCTDNVQNFDEEDIDCGGSTCEACPTCDDGIQNQDETGVDCGGPCSKLCDVDGGWSNWIDEGTCSQSCGGGLLNQTRGCTNPAPVADGTNCTGDTTQSIACNTQLCDVDGGWSNWSDDGICNKSCGGGLLSQTRSCTNPAPVANGANCTGDSTQSIDCNTQLCDVDDEGTCSKSCGSGLLNQTRSCTNPVPVANGLDCVGIAFQQIDCNVQLCDIDGGWSNWIDDGACSKSCGGGLLGQTRSCTNPAPVANGAICIGDATQSIECNTQLCDVDGGWSTWVAEGACSKTCGGGTQTQSRTCTNPSPVANGVACPGDTTQSIECNSNVCGATCVLKPNVDQGYKPYCDTVIAQGSRQGCRSTTFCRWVADTQGETCYDKILNNGEEKVDCGGPCDACHAAYQPYCDTQSAQADKSGCKATSFCRWLAVDTCGDGILNNGEKETDCGGPCDACPKCILKEGFDSAYQRHCDAPLSQSGREYCKATQFCRWVSK
eukprot:Awhi_evm1s6560